ncbi:MAG: hypothetical protein JSR48_01845 [Verrucomicrobia bacterium]|nr:hypothetical protein [Verrucomicrobiota bacterium]
MKTPLCTRLRHAAVLLLLTPAGLFAQAPSAPPPASHDFDFWLGEWNVTTPDGKVAGKSRIESVANGRGLLENWEGDPASGGGNGKSLNTYNAAKGQWQQFWVGSGGGVLELAGGLVDGRMVLTGRHVVRGATVTERISWSPNADGSVRQLWEQSRDDGRTWNVVFDGHYQRAKR